VNTKKIIIDKPSIKKQHDDSNKNASDEPGAIQNQVGQWKKKALEGMAESFARLRAGVHAANRRGESPRVHRRHFCLSHHAAF
jgi:hypothetical protein